MVQPSVPPGGLRPSEKSLVPSVSFFQLTERTRSNVPAVWKNGKNFTITRLQSPCGLSHRIVKTPIGEYQLWADGKEVPMSYVPSFRSNVIDFDASPACWAERAFDFIHYHVPRETLNDIAYDLEFGPVCEYRQATFEQDLVLAQITRNILPSITRENKLGSLALDQFELTLGAHLLQRYGGMARMHPPKAGGLAKWQRQRAMELLRENLNGNVRLADLAKECGLSVSHFARSFKTAFGVSSHQWLIRQRIDLGPVRIWRSGRVYANFSSHCRSESRAVETSASGQVVAGVLSAARPDRSIGFILSTA